MLHHLACSSGVAPSSLVREWSDAELVEHGAYHEIKQELEEQAMKDAKAKHSPSGRRR